MMRTVVFVEWHLMDVVQTVNFLEMTVHWVIENKYLVILMTFYLACTCNCMFIVLFWQIMFILVIHFPILPP